MLTAIGYLNSGICYKSYTSSKTLIEDSFRSRYISSPRSRLVLSGRSHSVRSRFCEDLTDFEGFGTGMQVMNRIVIQLITKEQLLPSIEFLS